MIIEGPENHDGPVEADFARVPMRPWDPLVVTAVGKPVAVWVPSGATVIIEVSGSGAVLDVSEAVDHDDIVSLDARVTAASNRERAAVRALRRAVRWRRGLADRPNRQYVRYR